MNAVPWMAVVTLAGGSAIVAALVFATHQWLLLVAVGATIEAAIYAVGSYCVLALRRKDTRERPFRLVCARPLATFGLVLFSLLALASGLSDPKDAHRLSVAPVGVIALIALASVGYVVLVLPKVRARALARSAASRPKRRPNRPDATSAGSPGPSGD